MNDTIIKIKTNKKKNPKKTIKEGMIIDLKSGETLYTASSASTHTGISRNLRKSGLIPTNIKIEKKETEFKRK